MRILQILAVWTAVSVPVSVATGFLLAGDRDLRRLVPARTAPPRRTPATTS